MIKHDLEFLLFALENLDNSLETQTGRLMLEDMRRDINAKLKSVAEAEARGVRRRKLDDLYGERSIVRDMREESRN